MKKAKIDKFDNQILKELQTDSSQPVSVIAHKIGISQTATWTRIKNLEKQGVIERRIVLVNPEKMGQELITFIAIKTNRHNSEWLKEFSKQISKLHEVQGFYRIGGSYDYILKVILPNMQSYDTFYKKMISKISIFEVTAFFVMERIKDTTFVDAHFD